MMNLLPPQEKEKLLLEKKKKIAIILWFLVLFFLTCLILISLSNKIYLQSQVKLQKALLVEAEKEFRQPEIQSLRKKISSLNSTLTRLNSFYQQKIYFSDILEKTSSVLPQEVFLTNFSAAIFFAEEELGIKVSLSGFAPTRDTLFELKKNLEKKEDFKEVYFPPANWVRPTDIDFSVTFKVDIRY